MGAISKLSEKCMECPKVKNCNNKRKEACAYMPLPKKLSKDTINPLTNPLIEPAAKPRTPIIIKMGEYGDIHTSLEQIHENIMKSFAIKFIDD